MTLTVCTVDAARKLALSHSPFSDDGAAACLAYSVTVARAVSFRTRLRKNMAGRAHASCGLSGRVLNTNGPSAQLRQVRNVRSGTSSSCGATAHGYTCTV
jgi:hypothetical protein